MREFLRREALWAIALGVSDDLPFVDLPELLSPRMNIAADELELVDSFSRSHVEKISLVYMLKWNRIPLTLLQESGMVLPTEPYLPLLTLFNLGGGFSREHRVYIDVNRTDGIHAEIVQAGNLDTPFAAVGGG